MPLTPLEQELLIALKLMLQAWNNAVDPNSVAVETAWQVVKKAEAKRQDEDEGEVSP